MSQQYSKINSKGDFAMFFFKKKKNEKVESKFKGRKKTPEVVNARKLLEAAHPTSLPRDGSAMSRLCGCEPFNYLGSYQHGEYTRYHFCEGLDKRIIYIIPCMREIEKLIQLFGEKMPKDKDEFGYVESAKGMFIGETVQHRFYSSKYKAWAHMDDDGNIVIPTILNGEDMED